MCNMAKIEKKKYWGWVDQIVIVPKLWNTIEQGRNKISYKGHQKTSFIRMIAHYVYNH